MPDNVLCRKMATSDVADAHKVLSAFLTVDEFYIDSSSAYGAGDKSCLDSALKMFIDKPELGFVWLAYLNNDVVGACVICFAISTSIGGIVAKMDDVHIIDGHQGKGYGSQHLSSLKEELQRMGVKRIDTSVHFKNDGAKRFYMKSGFSELSEERLSLVIPSALV